MRKLTAFLILAAAAMTVCTETFAQPRAMGARAGATGFDASYQHSMNRKQFIECDFGVDFGYNACGRPGVKATAIYNFIWARPAWTAKGVWSLYAGPGLTVGFVDDMVPYELEGNMKGYNDNGFAVAVAAQVGLEYMFDFPLALAVDIRPYFGVHINDGNLNDPLTGTRVSLGRKTGFYDNGVLGFIPSIAVRYRF